MSATRMLVLGIVKLIGEAHGYQVRRELRNWSAERWASVQPGSIYHALKSLAKDDLLEATGTEESGEGPARTVYRITPEGETELLTMVGRALADATTTLDELGAGIALLTMLPRRQAIVLLKHRLTGLEGQLPSARHAVTSYPEMGMPEHASELARLWVAHIEAQLTWTRELLERLEAGRYNLSE